MTTTHATNEVESYLADVRARLIDIPDEERAELLDDVATHVHEVATEHGAENLRERLGPPEEFADELRASAGYRARDTSGSSATGRQWRTFLRVPDGVRNERVGQVWARLEPAWWLVRGVLIADVILTGVGSARRDFIPAVGASHLVGLLLLVAAAAGSYALGERRPAQQSSRARRARITAEVALALFGLFYLAQASHDRVQIVTFDKGAAASDGCLRDSSGRAIGNLFAFDSTGKLIPQFFLTDQAGRAIDNLCPEQADPGDPNGPAQTSYARDVNGAAVYNVFPRQQQRATAVDPATGQPTGSAPVPAPAVLLPQIAPTPTTVVAPAP